MTKPKAMRAQPTATTLNSRRRFIQGLSVLPFCSASALAFSQAAAQSPIALAKLHSFGLLVSDVARSVTFYQAVFGASVQARHDDKVILRIGDGPRFFSISPTSAGQSPGISHIGLGLENYSLEAVVAQLQGFGLSAIDSAPAANSLEGAMNYWVNRRANGAADLYFRDIEGISYQLSSLEHCGGSGFDGEVCTGLELSPSPGMFRLADLSHFTTFLANKDRANKFYTETFGLSYQAYQGENFPIVGVGDGLQFLMYVGGADESAPQRPGRIDHVCFNMRDFSVVGILQQLTDFGLTARMNDNDTQPLMHWVSLRMPNRGGVEGGTPEVYFSDPDGIRIQLQDIGYCGGGGYLGDSCPPL
ncbi:MAG: catechol 2,3-dioxygenase-like lactoylglutathione lyase family enzyme [Pseudohongiellaceae bacterium]|jgi:catechol 2,3-dioxygenase-like lactoylglutathione lyase family enzyme